MAGECIWGRLHNITKINYYVYQNRWIQKQFNPQDQYDRIDLFFPVGLKLIYVFPKSKAKQNKTWEEPK